MNEIVNKYLFAGDKFIPEMYLRHPGFTYSACGPLTKNKERIKKFKDTEDSRYIYQSDLDKSCFQHDRAYGDFKDLTRRAASDKILRDKDFILLKIRNMMDISVDLLQWSISLLIQNIFVGPLRLQINLQLKMKYVKQRIS